MLLEIWDSGTALELIIKLDTMCWIRIAAYIMDSSSQPLILWMCPISAIPHIGLLVTKQEYGFYGSITGYALRHLGLQ